MNAKEKELNELVDNIYSSGYVRGKRNEANVDDIWAGLIDLVNEYTNSKLNKIIEGMEGMKKYPPDTERDLSFFYIALDEAMDIIKKEITKKD